eukprot:jgi/Picsp_1/1765/NSC_05237-R1_---NA---
MFSNFMFNSITVEVGGGLKRLGRVTLNLRAEHTVSLCNSAYAPEAPRNEVFSCEVELRH